MRRVLTGLSGRLTSDFEVTLLRVCLEAERLLEMPVILFAAVFEGWAAFVGVGILDLIWEAEVFLFLAAGAGVLSSKALF